MLFFFGKCLQRGAPPVAPLGLFRAGNDVAIFISLPPLAREIRSAGCWHPHGECHHELPKSHRAVPPLLTGGSSGGISKGCTSNGAHGAARGRRRCRLRVPRLSHSNCCLTISKAWGEPTAKPRPDSRLVFCPLHVAPFMLEPRCGKLLGGDVCTSSDRLNRHSFPRLLLPFKSYLPDS